MRPLWKDFLLLVMQPLLNKSTTPLENISEWIPKSLWSCRAFRTASGMLPIPICSVAPSLTRFSAISLPIFVSTSEILPVGCSGRSSQISVAKSKCDLWMMPSPKVRGILGLICAGRSEGNKYYRESYENLLLLSLPIIFLEFNSAARTQSTLVPNEQKPWRSGGDTWTSATSGWIIFW